MIRKAKLAGASAVKFQKRDVNKVYSKKFLKSFRESPWGNTQEDQKKGLEFDKTNYDQIDNYCKSIDIDWFASAWDLESLNFLKKYNTKYNKVASPMIIDQNFLEAVASEKKKTFISTGMSEIDHIEKAVSIFRSLKCEFELMHCISQYPFEDNLANLRMINFLREKFNCNVGYSGHEKGGKLVSTIAVAFGATSIERHVTLDRTMYGSDQASSITFKTLHELVEQIKIVEKINSGKLEKKILDIEVPAAQKLREHLEEK